MTIKGLGKEGYISQHDSFIGGAKWVVVLSILFKKINKDLNLTEVLLS
jgi:hypothetical protein